MEKKLISKKQFEFLEEEINYHRENGIIDTEQAENMLDFYEVRGGLSFVRVVLILGALLLGLGILSLIASNWNIIGRVFKLLIILVLILASDIAGYRFLDRFPRTGRSLIYLGALVYGAGIFLIGQMFNYGGHFSDAFLLWAVGVFPLAFYFGDKLMFSFADVLLVIYTLGYINLERIPYLMILIVPFIYYLNGFFEQSKRITFFNNAVLLSLLAEISIRLELKAAVTFLLLFAVGVLWYYIPAKNNSGIYKLQGMLTFGICGLFLTVSGVWGSLGAENFAQLFSIIFTVLYLLFLLTIVRKGHITALVFFCLTIFRFYFDTMYDFMPKSMFFIIGGLMLLGFGFYFERMLKTKGGRSYEE